MCVSINGPGDLTFDLLTLKLVREWHLRWGTFLPNLGTLGIWVLELFAMYATERRTDGQKQRLLALSLWAGAQQLIHGKTMCSPRSRPCISHSTGTLVDSIPPAQLSPPNWRGVSVFIRILRHSANLPKVMTPGMHIV